MDSFILNRTPKSRPPNPFVVTPTETSMLVTSEFQEGVVIDVITSDKHPSYATGDGFNIGTVKFRLIKTNAYNRSEDSLSWAFPISSNITNYPLINEIVLIGSYLGRLYYIQNINTTNKVSVSPIIGLKEELSSPRSNIANITDIQASKLVPNKSPSSTAPIFGKYFQDVGISRLRNDEGDIIFEGRTGQSIRFGTAWTAATQEAYSTNFKSIKKNQAPNLILTTRFPISSTSQDFVQLYTEDINKDDSSIWVVADQLIPIIVATDGIAANKKSIPDYPILDGPQIVLNSGRIMLNSKTDRIMGQAYSGIHWTSGQNFSIDAQENYLSYIGGFSEYTVQDRFSIICDKIYLGMQKEESQPVPLGKLLADFLQAFIDAHLNNAEHHTITATGTGVLDQSVVVALTQLKEDVAKGPLSSFNSRGVFAK